MPSPFPGMDPYLEDPVVWPDLHNRLMTYLADRLNQVLPPRYVARIEKRVYLVQPDRDIFPDVTVKEHLGEARPRKRGKAGAAAAVTCDPPWDMAIEPYEVEEAFIEIRPPRERDRIVTTIELLSPSNKLAGSEGRQAYRLKQRQIMAGPAHLLELDLLREGEHTAAAPPPEHLRRRGPYDYLVSLSRGGRRGRCQAWPFTVRQRLPRVLVPLGEGEDDVVLDLPGVFNRAYDGGAYDRDIDYTVEPVIALRETDAEWADTLLRKKGFRKQRRPRGRNGT
jgi:hypothetical protein